MAVLIQALAAVQNASPGQAAELLRQAIAALEAVETHAYAAAAKRRLGQLIGGAEGDALIAASDAWMQEQEVANPQRLTAMLAPGAWDHGARP